jgi:predicted  nucleic acid-binding Zn-ribbon protein
MKSNEKEWDELKEMKAQMKTSAGQMNKLGDAYASASNILGDAINNSQYKQIERLEFNNQIKNNTSQLNQSLSDINAQIKAYNQKLEAAKTNGQIKDSTYQSKIDLITKMSGELNKIKSAVKSISVLESSFQLKNNKNNKIWIGENTKSNALIKNIEEQINKIYKGQTQFRILSAKLNEK